MLILRIFFCVCFIVYITSAKQSFLKKRDSHIPKQLSNNEIRYLSNLSNIKNMEEILSNILIPRVVGSVNHDKVADYITEKLERNGFHVSYDDFEEYTPTLGKLTFRNIIATLNPNAERFLVLACHYDSKYFKDAEFVGATDSAVPCAMMLNLISVLQNDLKKAKSNNDVSLQLIFFDGEEAFKEWTAADSLYGSRHLAQVMDKSDFVTRSRDVVKDIHRIDLLVLLDLIGHSTPQFYSFFRSTEKWYERLVNAEQRLAKLHLLNTPKLSFNKRSTSIRMEDDHIPFLQRGVPIVHLISVPFPNEWHTPADNSDIIDLQVTENINKVLRIFVAEYLHLLESGDKEENFKVEL